MTQLSKEQAKQLKELITKAEPYSGPAGEYGNYYHCCDLDRRYGHSEDCCWKAWDKLDTLIKEI